MPIQQISEKSIFALVIDYYYLCNKNCLIREYRCKHREGSVSKSLPLILFSSDYQIYILDSHFWWQKHNLAFLKPLPLSGAETQSPLFPLSKVADHDPDCRIRFPGASDRFFGRSDSRWHPCICGRNSFGRWSRCGDKDDAGRRSCCVRFSRCRKRRGSPNAG